jgi:precorrin-6B methylase 1
MCAAAAAVSAAAAQLNMKLTHIPLSTYMQQQKQSMRQSNEITHGRCSTTLTHHEAQPHAALHKHVAAEERPKPWIVPEELLKDILRRKRRTASAAAKTIAPKTAKA